MHWTLIVLLSLCGLCALANVISIAAARSLRVVRMAGVFICSTWLIQQGYWARHGEDSLALFIACDSILIAWFFWALTHRQSFTVAERLIAATIPVTTAFGVYAWLNGGHTTESWWLNWWLVAGQMMLGLPLSAALIRRLKRSVIEQPDPWVDFERTRHEPAA